ncbi:MAG: hypothetical protein V4508_17145 [Pseudomonadota bacterium]
MNMTRLAFTVAMACASGQLFASGTTDLEQQRTNRKADIAYYTSNFDGGDVNLNCARPSIPPISKTNEEIVKVDANVQAWFTCYNGFVQTMNDALPAGKRIPADLVAIMRPDELNMARQRMDKAYGVLADEAQTVADAILAEHKSWRESTVAFATTTNAETKKKLEARLIAYEIMIREKYTNRDNIQGGKVGPSASK